MNKNLNLIKSHWMLILAVCLVFLAFIAAPLTKWAKESKIPLADKLPTVTPPPAAT